MAAAIRRAVLGGAAVAAVAGAAPAAGAQESLFERLHLDDLRFSAIGGGVGAVKPSQMDATRAYTLFADYGAIAEHWRLVFSATYWGSHLNDETLARYRDTLRNVIVDPDSNYVLDVGRVSISDIALTSDFRWLPRPRAALRPYLGAGVGAHVLNAEGKAIAGTFVERALDNITAGLSAVGGVDVVLFRRVSIGGQARYDLVSGARFGSVRAVAGYIFDTGTRPATR